MLAMTKPLIAAVHGYALGAGCEMTMLCDLRIASDDARFGLPEVNLGYIPSAGGTQLAPRLIGPGHALYMVLSGEPVDARTALDYGLVQWVVPRERLWQEAESLAKTVLSRSPTAVRATKQAVLRGLELSLADGLQTEAIIEQRLAGVA
jgi:enoyl-CoA hydratase/carnithine racemase